MARFRGAAPAVLPVNVSEHSPTPLTEAAPGPGERPGGRLALVQALLDTALQAQRAGTLDELLRSRPRLVRWLLRRWLPLLRDLSADSTAEAGGKRVVGLLLRWLVTQLRPDSQASFSDIPDEAWLDLSGWRPMLAIAAVAGFVRVPDFPRRYRRSADEAPVDNLCGLWDVGPSTIYRTLERARHAMALVLLDSQPDAVRRLSLRAYAAAEACAQLGLHTEPERQRWHAAQIERARQAKDPVAELWHAWRAGRLDEFIDTLRRQATLLAADSETEALVHRVGPMLQGAAQQVDLWLARAALARTRNAAGRELRAYEQARQVAHSAGDSRLQGLVYSELGKFYEARDADRAFACYQDSAEFLRQLPLASAEPRTLTVYALTLTRLAWLYVMRNDERCRAVLDRAEELRPRLPADVSVVGMLEQVWAEYWRRAGEPTRALEHRYRALNIFERLGDRRSQFAALVNLITMHGEAGHHARAVECAHAVFEGAREGIVEPAMVVSARLNLGLAHVAQGRLDDALHEFDLGLQQSLASDLPVHAFRARHNLAEARYLRFRETGDPQDEAAGDRLVEAALAMPPAQTNPADLQSTRQLKADVLKDVLQQRKATEADRLLPSETASHLDEMTEVAQQRQLLALPGDPAAHARAHLVIARSYLAISTKEREAALALIHKHGLQAQFTAEFEELKQTFQRELTREQHLADAWKRAAADVVDDSRRAPLIAHIVREGSINKSAYVDLCAVSPATASKHLGLLAERGLLAQKGKGPSTRYELPG